MTVKRINISITEGELELIDTVRDRCYQLSRSAYLTTAAMAFARHGFDPRYDRPGPVPGAVEPLPAPAQKRPPLVYIAGPLTTGDESIWSCVRDAVTVAEYVLDCGGVPLVPHLNVLWAMVRGRAAARPHEEWLTWCKHVLEHCDVVCRLAGRSVGAEEECQFADSKGIPVVNRARIAAWISDWTG